MQRFLFLVITLARTGCAGSGLDLFGGGGPAGETAAANETCPGFADFDADDTGFLDTTGFRNGGTSSFRAWDDTGDGLLSFNEYNDCIGPNAEESFARLDANRDRMISLGEFTSEAQFAAWDRNDDRQLGECLVVECCWDMVCWAIQEYGWWFERRRSAPNGPTGLPAQASPSRPW